MADETSSNPGEESMATRRRIVSHADLAGATLIVVAALGVVASAWRFVRTQFVVDDPGSLGDRLDLLAAEAPLLVLSCAVAGIGIGLRTIAGAQPDAPVRPVLGRPVGRIALAVATALMVFLGGALLVADNESGVPGSEALDADQLIEDDFVPGIPPVVADLPGLAPTKNYTLELHSDGCGVFRSGNIGDRANWKILDQDGFQTLTRNAAGETQYRYTKSGTYTVVLEAWGGGYYVDVSNTVTITC